MVKSYIFLACTFRNWRLETMKLGDDYIGFTGEEIVAAVMGNDVEAITAMIEGFDLKRTFEPRPLSYDGWKISSALLNYASIFAGRSMVSQEVATLLIDNLSMDVNAFLFLDMLLFFTHNDKKSDNPHVPEKILKILEKNEANDEFAGYVAMMNENEFISLCEYLTSGKVEKLNISFSPPLIRFVYTHQMMPLTLQFAYMASTLRQPAPKLNALCISGAIGQLLDGLFGESEVTGDESTE